MGLKCVVSFLGVALLGCTSPNPRSCADGFCHDPALPFCDVDGSLGGTPKTCVAVDCLPGEFVACRGDQAISCNADATNYEVTACQLGCEGAIGCVLCEPNQTACTNGTAATCDADGNVVASEKCHFDCFEDEPRCRDIEPSNGLSTFVDMVTMPSDLMLDGADIFTESGEIMQQGQPVTDVTSFLVQAPQGGAMVRVFIAKDVVLRDVSARRNAASDPTTTTVGPALAIVATGSIRVEGRFRVYGGAGGVDIAGCSGGAGGFESDQGRYLSAGHGGGAHATAGARGGDVGGAYLPGGSAGMPSGTSTLVPLRGGCPGRTAPGGGALQLSARGEVVVDGIIDARGATMSATAGGGAGGGILLEGAVVELTSAGKLIATGGGGGAGSNFMESYIVSPPRDDGSPQQGSQCGSPSMFCTTGGNGAAVGVSAMPGTGATLPQTAAESGAGGGGGGLGRIRINTRDATYVKSTSSVEAGELTTGTAATR